MRESISRFLELYPDAQIVDSPTNEKHNLNFFIGGRWVSIAKDNLNEREQFLFSLINQNKSEKKVQNNWWDVLTGVSQDFPKIDTEVKIFQFQIDKIQTRDQAKQWLDVFKDTIDNVVDAFLTGENTGILIQSKNKVNIDLSSVSQMVELLDSDFYTKTHMFVGEPWPVNDNLSKIFDQERSFFHSSLYVKDKVNNLSTVILDYLIDSNLKKTVIFKKLHQRIDINLSTANMINTLYRCDSNVAKASKLLFLHRNTLQYRIEKFFELTGFDLKNHDDLALCFLLLK